MIMAEIPEITPSEVHKKLGNDDFILLDVRENNERAVAKVEGSIHIPVIEVPARLNELDKNKEIAVTCLGGGRSSKITKYLLSQGFTNVKNMVGGIRRWSEQIDQSIPKYRLQKGQIIQED